jgi:hypothetical protein
MIRWIAGSVLLFTLVSMPVSCINQKQEIVVAPTPTVRILVGPNQMIPSQSPGLPVVEPHLSVHPDNPDHLLVAAMVIQNKDNPYESATLSSFVSIDGGIGWTQTEHNYWGYDPWTVILPGGTTLMSWLGQPEKFTGQMAVQMFSSATGGSSWSPNVQTIPGEFDGTKMAVHPSGSKVYFAAAKFAEDMKVDVFLSTYVKPDGFVHSQVIDSKGKMRSFTQPVVLSNGCVVVPMAGEGGDAWVYISDTEGKAFSGPFPITRKLGRAKGYFQLVVDESQTPTRDRVYFIRAAGPAGQYDGIWVNASSDGGKTWSSDIRVDSVAGQLPCRALVPVAAVNNAGILCVSWVDRQHNPDKNDVYVTVSQDGGKTFMPPVRVTDVSSDPATPGNADVANKFPGGGHYLSMAAKPDGSFQLVWSDSRTGVFQLQTCTLKLGKSEK